MSIETIKKIVFANILFVSVSSSAYADDLMNLVNSNTNMNVQRSAYIQKTSNSPSDVINNNRNSNLILAKAATNSVPIAKKARVPEDEKKINQYYNYDNVTHNNNSEYDNLSSDEKKYYNNLDALISNLVLNNYENKQNNNTYAQYNNYAQNNKSSNGFIVPVNYKRVSSGYGSRLHPVKKVVTVHTGVDFAAARGTPIKAANSGVVTYAGVKGGYGNTVIIEHDNGIATLYGHIHEIKTRVGDRVNQGDLIATVGSTGLSTGPHLHFEVLKNGQKMNPNKLLNGYI